MAVQKFSIGRLGVITIRMRLWLCGALAVPLAVIAQNEVPTQFDSSLGGIVNTRHNMMQSTEMSNSGATMNPFRNRYGGVCIYCHTPHGANDGVAAPLWNRKASTGPYTTYDQLNTSTLTQAVYAPGGASLPCLSCHDGSQAIDAILNMPGSGNYSATADPTSYVPGVIVNTPGGYAKSTQHRNMGTVLATSCLACHNADSGGLGGGVATDFTVFAIGTDLRNDHPVGVTYPSANGTGTDWKTPGGTKVVSASLTAKFFDDTPNGRLDKSEIRLYDSGHGASVECASCHDPHGVWDGAAIIPTFLRKSIAGSDLCLTCHAK